MRKKKTRHRMFHLLDCLLILSLSVFVLLDNFVIVREYQEISQTSQAAEESGNALSSYVYAAEEITDDDSSEEVASVQEEASKKEKPAKKPKPPKEDKNKQPDLLDTSQLLNRLKK